MTDLTREVFDYSIVTTNDRSDLMYYADQTLKARDTAAKSIIKIGEHLTAANDKLSSYPGDTFIQWVEKECGFSLRSAYRYMAVHRVFGSCASVAQLEHTALYALSENKTPEKARLEAMKLADRGHSVTHAKAKEIIAKHSSKAEPGSETGKPGGDETSLLQTPEPDGPASSDSAAADAPWYADAIDSELSDSGGVTRTDSDVARTDSGGTDSDSDETAPPPPRNGTDDIASRQAGGDAPEIDPEKAFKTQRSKTVKTAEALVRAFDDLNRLRSWEAAHLPTIYECQCLITRAQEWGG